MRCPANRFRGRRAVSTPLAAGGVVGGEDSEIASASRIPTPMLDRATTTTMPSTRQGCRVWSQLYTVRTAPARGFHRLIRESWGTCPGWRSVATASADNQLTELIIAVSGCTGDWRVRDRSVATVYHAACVCHYESRSVPRTLEDSARAGCAMQGGFHLRAKGPTLSTRGPASSIGNRSVPGGFQVNHLASSQLRMDSYDEPVNAAWMAVKSFRSTSPSPLVSAASHAGWAGACPGPFRDFRNYRWSTRSRSLSPSRSMRSSTTAIRIVFLTRSPSVSVAQNVTL